MKKGSQLMIYEKNLEKFCQKYPKLSFDAITWQREKIPFKPIDEWIKKLKIDQVDLLCIYGVDDGKAYEALKPWLSSNPKRKLIFLEEKTGYIAELFHQQMLVLEDDQVEIMAQFSIEEIAEKFPKDQVEIVALPGRGGAKFQKMRSQLLQKISLERSLFLERTHGHLISKRFIKNLPRVNEAFYANRLKGSFKNIPAIICGAGPSLEDDLPILKRLDSRAILIGGGSALGALTVNGIQPHFGMAVDPNVEEFLRFKNSFFFEGPFLFSTRLCPYVFSTLNGPYGYLRSGVGSISELFLEEEQKIDDEPLLGAELSQDAIAVTPLAVAYANLLGCNPIILTGVDLAYTKGRRYASGVEFELSVKELEAEKNATNQILVRKDKSGKKVLTAVRWEMERQSLADFARKNRKTRFVNATKNGLRIRGFEEIDLEETISNFAQIPHLRERIDFEIKKHPMPPIGNLVEKLKKSLEKTIECLEIMTEEKKGSSALAECDLLEEVATAIFLADLPKVCRQHFNTDSPDPKECFKLYLQVARNHYSYF